MKNDIVYELINLQKNITTPKNNFKQTTHNPPLTDRRWRQSVLHVCLWWSECFGKPQAPRPQTVKQPMPRMSSHGSCIRIFSETYPRT